MAGPVTKMAVALSGSILVAVTTGMALGGFTVSHMRRDFGAGYAVPSETGGMLASDDAAGPGEDWFDRDGASPSFDAADDRDRFDAVYFSDD